MPLRKNKATQNLATGALDAQFNFADAVELVSVYIHFSEAITETVKVTFKSADGSNYDTLIDSKVLNNQQDYVFAAQGCVAFDEGDIIKVTCTNGNTTGIAYVSVKVRTRRQQ